MKKLHHKIRQICQKAQIVIQFYWHDINITLIIYSKNLYHITRQICQKQIVIRYYSINITLISEWKNLTNMP